MNEDLFRKLGLSNPIYRSSAADRLPSTAIPLAQTASGLWLPRSAVNRLSAASVSSSIDRPAILEFSVTTLGWNDLTGGRATLDGVIARFARYSLRELVSLVSRVSVALELGENAFEPLPVGVFDTPYLRRQFWILQRLGGVDFAVRAMTVAKQRLDDQGAGHGRIAFFQDRQTLNALKLGLLVVDLETDDNGESALPFLEALFMMTDLIDPAEGTMNPDELELYIAANTLFNERPSPLPEWVRAHTLYVEQRPEVAGRGAVNVSAQLARATGVEATTAWVGLFALYAFWGTLEFSDLDAGKITASRKTYFSALTELPSDIRDAWLSLAITDIGDIQRRVRERYALDNIRWFDVLPFEERPLIAFDDLVFCPSRWLFDRLPGSSLQYRLIDEKVFDQNDRRRFLDTRGHLVEWYTMESVHRAFGTERVLDEASLQAVAPGEKVCDAIIVYPDALILLECKTFAVLLDTRHAENYAAYRKKWRDAVNKAADQFESTIRLLRSGAFKSLGIAPEMLDEIIPVIGVFEQPVTPLTYRAIRDRDLQNHPLAAMAGPRGVRPFQLMDISEIESWERAAESGKSVLDLLRAKLRDSEATELSFHHFVHLQGESFVRERTRWHAERWNAIADDASEQLHAYGLREEMSDG